MVVDLEGKDVVDDSVATRKEGDEDAILTDGFPSKDSVRITDRKGKDMGKLTTTPEGSSYLGEKQNVSRQKKRRTWERRTQTALRLYKSNCPDTADDDVLALVLSLIHI